MLSFTWRLPKPFNSKPLEDRVNKLEGDINKINNQLNQLSQDLKPIIDYYNKIKNVVYLDQNDRVLKLNPRDSIDCSHRRLTQISSTVIEAFDAINSSFLTTTFNLYNSQWLDLTKPEVRISLNTLNMLKYVIGFNAVAFQNGNTHPLILKEVITDYNRQEIVLKIESPQLITSQRFSVYGTLTYLVTP